MQRERFGLAAAGVATRAHHLPRLWLRGRVQACCGAGQEAGGNRRRRAAAAAGGGGGRRRRNQLRLGQQRQRPRPPLSCAHAPSDAIALGGRCSRRGGGGVRLAAWGGPAAHAGRRGRRQRRVGWLARGGVKNAAVGGRRQMSSAGPWRRTARQLIASHLKLQQCPTVFLACPPGSPPRAGACVKREGEVAAAWQRSQRRLAAKLPLRALHLTVLSACHRPPGNARRCWVKQGAVPTLVVSGTVSRRTAAAAPCPSRCARRRLRCVTTRAGRLQSAGSAVRRAGPAALPRPCAPCSSCLRGPLQATARSTMRGRARRQAPPSAGAQSQRRLAARAASSRQPPSPARRFKLPVPAPPPPAAVVDSPPPPPWGV